MALKSVIEIDLADQNFQRFKDLFDRYNEEVKKQPALWKSIGQTHKKLVDSFQAAAVAAEEHSKFARKIVVDSDVTNTSLAKSEGLWTSIARSSRSVLGSVISTGEGLLKWTGILGAIGGLLGGAGLWGLDKMAGGVAGRRRDAMGLGMGYGQMRSFDINYQRLLDPGAYLGSINAMETDITKQGAAYALTGHGMTGNTANDALTMLQAARNLAQRTPLNQLGPMFGAYGLSGTFDTETQRRLQTMSGAEYKQLQTDYTKNIPKMDVQDKVAKGWTDLITQLDRAGAEISKVFVTGLFPLENPLKNLSETFVTAVQKFANSDMVKHGIEKLGEWLDLLNTKFEPFANELTDLANSLHTIAHPLEAAGNWFSDVGAGIKNLFVPDAAYLNTHPDRFTGYLGQLDQHFQLGHGMIEAIKQSERSGPTAVNPISHAMGMFQFKPETWAQYGNGGDPFNQTDAANATGRYLAALEKEFHGDIAMTLAAYNAGPGTIESAVGQATKTGKDWRTFIPQETRQYLMNAQPVLQALNPGLTINLMNSTGGSAAAVVSALAH